MEGRCPRNPGAATAITTPRHQNTRLACPTRNQAISPLHQAPPEAPVTLEPDSSVARKIIWGGDREGTPRTGKLQKLNQQRHANRVMYTLQAHGTTTHELTQNTTRQSQSLDSHGHMTTANSMEHTNAKQTLKHGQDIGQRLHRTPPTRPPPGHNSVHSQTISKRYITHQMLADGQNTNTTCKRKRY